MGNAHIASNSEQNTLSVLDKCIIAKSLIEADRHWKVVLCFPNARALQEQFGQGAIPTKKGFPRNRYISSITKIVTTVSSRKMHGFG